MCKPWWIALGMVFAPMLAHAATPQRVVSLGGDITETVYMLGAQSALVGRDSTSQWPADAARLPDVGYVRQLAAEGILSLHPQLIIATHDAGPPPVISQLQSAGVHIETLPVSYTPDAVIAKVRTVGQLLDKSSVADREIAQLQSKYSALAKVVAAMPRHPKVVFMMSAGSGSPMLAGRDTAATHAMTLAGGVNPVVDYTGYKPVSPESLAALAPDVIVLMRERADTLGGVDGVLRLPGVALTPAGKARRVVTIDGQALLGFGPRNADEELALQRELAAADE
ncbi:heme/hemin ABC transporter substrate-binding protein [Dyella sp.]|uniref:heme/hemin ABC transporter substrate-binding protein n=1 Tax=Dyella sp. TaxID=1869338 RepID=UPI002ED64B0B